MKQRRIINLIAIVLFTAAIVAVPLYWFFAPERDFSDSERRYLTQAPVLSFRDSDNWSFDDDVEKYLADQLPLRDVFVGIDAYTTLYSGRQISTEIWVDRDGYLLEAPVDASDADIEKRMRRISALAETTDLTIRLMPLPSAGYVRRAYLPLLQARLYRDDVVESKLTGYDGVELVSLLDLFSGDGAAYYYRTDHHWNSDGAYAAYCAYMTALKRTPLSADSFYHHSAAGYVGSTRSRSALWLTPGETLTVYEPKCSVRVTFSDREGVFDSLFFYDRLKEYDWYPLFIDGNHSVTQIENLDAGNGEVLLVVKDSFANTLVPLLLPSYRTIIMVDLRYYRGAVSELCAQYGVTELAFVYAQSNLVTDTNLLLLK